MEIFIINTCVITMLMIIIVLTLLFGTTTAVAVAAIKRSNSDMKDKPDGKIIATPWGSYRRSSSAAEEMKTRFRNFKATKVVKDLLACSCTNWDSEISSRNLKI